MESSGLFNQNPRHSSYHRDAAEMATNLNNIVRPYAAITFSVVPVEKGSEYYYVVAYNRHGEQLGIL